MGEVEAKRSQGHTEYSLRRDAFRDSTIVLGSALFQAYGSLHRLVKFNDIVESWVDGGSSAVRYDELFAMLKNDKFTSAIDDAIRLSEQWVRSGPDGAPAVIAAHWINEQNATPAEAAKLAPIIGKAASNIVKSLAALKAIRLSIGGMLECSAVPYDTSRIDAELQAAIERSGDAILQIYNGARNLMMLYRGPRAPATIEHNLLRIYG